jgi:hypothetical protein
MKIPRLLLIPPAFLLFSACGAHKAYDGPSRRSSEVATVKSYGVTIRKVDDRSIGSSTTSVQVLPGKHEILVTPNASNYGMLNRKDSQLYIVMNAEAGKQYAITSKRGVRTLCAYECREGTSQPDFGRSAGCVVHPSLRKEAMQR